MITLMPQLKKNAITIRLRVVKTEEDWERALEVRWQGYGKYVYNGGCKYDSLDELDFAPNSSVCIAEDENGNALGTARYLDRRYGKIELDKFIDVDKLLPAQRGICVEGTPSAWGESGSAFTGYKVLASAKC